RLAVESHPLLGIQYGPARRELHDGCDDRDRDGEHEQRRRGQADIDDALHPRVEALERDVIDVDDRQAIEILETGAEGDELQDIGDDLDVNTLAAGEFNQVE